jgi:acyl-CoA synthetase (AMP-forming)/AMP-acid ligase II
MNPKEQGVVALLMPNSIDFIIAYLAIVKTGHIAMPLDPAYKPLEFDSIIDKISPRLIITNIKYSQKFSDEHQKNIKIFDDLRNQTAEHYKPLRLDATKQIASLTFTSGTTGNPKAVPNTHANHIWNIKVCSEVWDWTGNDTLLISVPLSHMLGIVMGLSGAIYHGNTIYLHEWFDETATLEALASGQISFFSQSASAYVKLAQSPNQSYDLSGVRLCVSGAAPLPPSVWQEFKQRYGIEILETYGTTETGRIAGNHLDERVPGSPGRPLPGVDLKLDKNGEVQIKSGGVFPGYYKNQAATSLAKTADGYWRTGDIAEVRDGYVFLKGRAQERIRRFGYTVSPRDVEWALHKHPKVKDVYVMGQQIESQPDDRLVYFIVGNLSNDEIAAFCKENMLFAWRPDRIIHLDELPRTRSGKPKIAKLKEIALTP